MEKRERLLQVQNYTEDELTNEIKKCQKFLNILKIKKKKSYLY